MEVVINFIDSSNLQDVFMSVPSYSPTQLEELIENRFIQDNRGFC